MGAINESFSLERRASTRNIVSSKYFGAFEDRARGELNAQAVTEENTPVLFLVTFRAAATKLDLADKFNLRGELEVLVLPLLKIW